MTINNTTPNYGLPLPAAGNDLPVDMGKIISAISMIDNALSMLGLTVAAKADGSALAAYQAIAQKNTPNGYAGLDATGKMLVSQIPVTLVAGLNKQGVWNAATNSPPIPAAAPSNRNWFYIVGVAGTTAIDGVSDWQPGDWIISNGASWDKIDNTDKFSPLVDNQFTAPQTMGGKLFLPAGTAASASFNVAVGVAPTSPVNGDFWMVPGGLFMQRAGQTFSLAQINSSGYFAYRVTPYPSTAGGSGFLIPPGVDPSAPINGEIWTTSTALKARLGGVTKTLVASDQTGAAPFYCARAWVCFTGTGTVTIRGSGNISSITDNGVGDYTINFAEALPTAEYAVALAAAGAYYAPPLIYATTYGGVPVLKTTSQCRIRYVPSDTPTDAHTITATFIC